MQATRALGPYDPIYLMVLEVSQADRDAIWSLCAPIGKLQQRPLKFWSIVLSSSAGNYSPFETTLDLPLSLNRD